MKTPTISETENNPEKEEKSDIDFEIDDIALYQYNPVILGC